MPYTAEISRRSPAYFVFLIDQSGSMNDPQGGNPGKTKAQSVADAINRIIQNLIIASSKSEGVLDYFCISVIGYGDGVKSAYLGDLAGRPWASTSELESSPARLESRKQRVPDGAGGLVDVEVKMPVWFDPVSSGRTPMCEAFATANGLVSAWVQKHPDGYPPIVMNLTDGEATDGNPSDAVRQLTSLQSADGGVLCFNMHLSSQAGQAALFPSSDAQLADNFARLLFSLSSPLPDAMLRMAQSMELDVHPGGRGFVYNADIVSIIQFLEIGTRPANLALR